MAKIKKRHIAIYGNIPLERGYCRDCVQTCIILDGIKQCCGGHVKGIDISEQPVIRISEPQFRRKHFSKEFKRKILNEQNYLCIYCGKFFGSLYCIEGKLGIKKTRAEFDHFIAFVYSANNKSENIVAACNICNGLKSDKMFNDLEGVTLYVTEKTKEKKISYL